MAISANTPGPVSLVLLQLPMPLTEQRLPGSHSVARLWRHLKESQELTHLLIVSLSPDLFPPGCACPYFGNDLELSLSLSQPSFLCLRVSQLPSLASRQVKSAQSAPQLGSVSVCMHLCKHMRVFFVVYQGIEL